MMKIRNRHHKCQFGGVFSVLGVAIVSLGNLITGHLAEAGIAAGPSIQADGRFELEFDKSTQQFTLIEIDSSGTETEVAYQEFFDKKEERNRLAGLLGLRAVMGTPPDPAGLVSFGAPPDYDNASIDVSKLALGACGRNCTGTGAGQIDVGETWRIDFLGFVVANPVWQIEVKQDFVGKVTYFLNDVAVGEHFVLSGRAASNPPEEVPEDASKCEVRSNISDGGPDSGNGDDGFCTDEDAPLHNAEVMEVIDGLGSIKGGGEFPIPDLSRTTWDYYVGLEAFLNCGDEAVSEGGEVTVLRSIENPGGGCPGLIGYVLAFNPDTNTVEWDVADPSNQNLGTIFDPVEFLPEPKIDPGTGLLSEIFRTLLSYTDQIDCGSATFPYFPPDGVATRTCIGLPPCSGQPVRACSFFGADGMPGTEDDLSCTTDEDCDFAAGETCNLINLEPGSLPGGVFPDLVPNTAVCEFSGASCTMDEDCEPDESCVEQREYACVFDDQMLYLGATGSCSITTSQSCTLDTDCPAVETCENLGDEEIQRTQGIFLIDDARISRGR